MNDDTYQELRAALAALFSNPSAGSMNDHVAEQREALIQLDLARVERIRFRHGPDMAHFALTHEGKKWGRIACDDALWEKHLEEFQQFADSRPER